MAKKHNFLEEDDEYASYYEAELSEKEEAFLRKSAKAAQKPKSKRKGHQAKHLSHSARALAEEEYLDSLTASEEIPSPRPKTKLLGAARTMAENAGEPSSPAAAAMDAPVQKFTFGPNSHEVKGSMIDFDRVIDIQKIEAEHNGHNTYGIKFLFAGKKGLFRIAWFNWNEKERDRVYEAEKAYWTSLESFLSRN